MSMVNHPNIVKLLEVIYTKHSVFIVIPNLEA